MKFRVVLLSLALGGTAGSAAMAHSLWLNVVPEPIEQHVIVSIAYGDLLPGSELLSTDWGNMTIASYELVTPDGKPSPLGVPVLPKAVSETLGTGLALQKAGDSGVRKVTFGPAATKGTYQLTAQSSVYQYIEYRDRQGAVHFSDQPYATLKDVKEVKEVSRDVFFMKAVHAAGGWTEPAALGLPFEIVPESDLNAARPGDLVRFKILLNGAAWSPSEGDGQLNAQNAAFGDRWGLRSPLKHGIGEFRIPNGGMWRVDAHFKARSGDFPQLIAGATAVPGVRSEDMPLYVQASLSFNVRP